MSILVYHGSPSSFKKFKIEEKLSNRSISLLAEGLGIYMSENVELASTYGSYLYQIELQVKDITNFTNEQEIRNLLQNMSNEVEIDLESEIDANAIITGLLSGNISTTSMFKEISDWLDNNESFHQRYGDFITYEDDCIFERIKNSFLQNVKDIILYYDKSFNAPVYICFKNEQNLKIINVTKID